MARSTEANHSPDLGDLLVARPAAGLDTSPPRAQHEWQADQIRATLATLLMAHEQWPETRAHVETWIARIYTATMRCAPARKRRAALLERIEHLAAGREMPFADFARFHFDHAYARAYEGISDEDLAGVIAVWSKAPGAKKAGGLGKWEALSRVIKKHWGDNTGPATLKKEAQATARGSLGRRNRG